MGIVALCFFWLPIVGLCLAVIGTLFGLSAILVALARRGAGLGFAIGGTTLAIVALFPSGKVTSVAVDVAAWLDDFQKDRGFTNDADEQRRAVELYRGFHVQKFRLTGSGELSDPTVVHALLINNTRFAISSVKLRVIHKHDQRQTPYFDEVLHLEIDGGIEPGESYEGAWEPNLFLSSIADEFQRKEAGFQIYKLCLYGPDEKALAADLEGVPIKSN